MWDAHVGSVQPPSVHLPRLRAGKPTSVRTLRRKESRSISSYSVFGDARRRPTKHTGSRFSSHSRRWKTVALQFASNSLFLSQQGENRLCSLHDSFSSFILRDNCRQIWTHFTWGVFYNVCALMPQGCPHAPRVPWNTEVTGKRGLLLCGHFHSVREHPPYLPPAPVPRPCAENLSEPRAPQLPAAALRARLCTLGGTRQAAGTARWGDRPQHCGHGDTCSAPKCSAGPAALAGNPPYTETLTWVHSVPQSTGRLL